jgi:hypothetical protein
MAVEIMKPTRNQRKTASENIKDNFDHLNAMARLMGKKEFAIANPITIKAPKQAKKQAYTAKNIPEAAIQKAVLQYLRICPQVAWYCRINSGAFIDGDRYIQANSQRGMSDIIGMLRGGRLFAIEVKSKTGRLLPHQQEFLGLIADGGGLAGVCRSVDDAQRLLFHFIGKE